MSINNIFSFLMPKEDKFFPLINEVGDTLEQAAECQVEFFRSGDLARREELHHSIKSFETHSDQLIAQIFRELNDSFITPFDREDIHELVENVDDIVDGINSCTKRVLLYRPKDTPHELGDMSHIVRKCAAAVNIALHELANVKKKPGPALKECDTLHDLESEADELYENFIQTIFLHEENSNTVELIKLKEIMQDLERTTDYSKDVGKIVKTIIVKYS